MWTDKNRISVGFTVRLMLDDCRMDQVKFSLMFGHPLHCLTTKVTWFTFSGRDCVRTTRCPDKLKRH